jgi:hypothetical protein
MKYCKIKKKCFNSFFYLNNQKGMALLGTLLFSFIMVTTVTALLTMSSNEIKLSALQSEYSDAFYLADSGTERAISWLEKQNAPPINIPAPFDGSVNIEGIGGGHYTVKIDPPEFFEETFNRVYTIESTGVAGYHNSTRTIESKVRVESFAGFAYFSDEEKNPSGETIWFRTNDVVGGKMHSNDLIHISGTPHFLGEVTTAANYIDYMENYYTRLNASGDFENNHPNIEDIFQSDATEWGLTLGSRTINLPQNREISGTQYARSLENITLGPSYNSSDVENQGVYVPTSGNNVNGGIYVKGNAEIILGTDASGNSKITIEQSGGIITEIVTDEIFRSTTITKYEYGSKMDGYPITRNGVSNGVMYVGGQVNNLEAPESDGGLQGKLTIAASDDIKIGDDILYHDRIENNIDFSSEDADLSLVNDSLGLVSEKDIMIRQDATGYYGDLEINAILMALDKSFYLENYTYGMKGELKVFGAFIQERRGAVGTFDLYNDNKISGFTKDYHYDKRMASVDPDVPSMIPPYFPTTGNYEIISWREK